MSGKRILLIVGGGIAAYKSLELIRLLAKDGIAARAILTKAGAEFVTPLSLGSLSGDKVYQDLFNLTDEAEMGHIELSRSADLVVVSPATADLMAKAANGLANDLASTTLLATDKPVLMAPAMNVRMWDTQRPGAMSHSCAPMASPSWSPTKARWRAASSAPAACQNHSASSSRSRRCWKAPRSLAASPASAR